ncbi:MAG: bifunctional adenosylcobinamide kinase/adenosylcobinamide-phosphate guanylyltransferase [Cyanobacteria bacterium P01_G01_bin.39]
MIPQQSDVRECDPAKIILVTGPSSSGKSELAEALAARSSQKVIYIATAQVDPTDHEWQAKIAKHILRRPPSWQTVSASKELSTYLDQASVSECLLIDSLGTWIANFMESNQAQWQQICDRLLTSLVNTSASVILVSEETGWGVVPAYPLGRLFRDRLGKLSRQISSLADVTYLVAGGHVINLSLWGEPLSKYEI